MYAYIHVCNLIYLHMHTYVVAVNKHMIYYNDTWGFPEMGIPLNWLVCKKNTKKWMRTGDTPMTQETKIVVDCPATYHLRLCPLTFVPDLERWRLPVLTVLPVFPVCATCWRVVTAVKSGISLNFGYMIYIYICISLCVCS